MVEERWVPVIGFDGYYEVSNYGNVRSIPRETPITITRGKKTKHIEVEYWRHKGKQLKPIWTGWGYTVHLYDAQRRRRNVSLGRLVYASFSGIHVDELTRRLKFISGDSRNCAVWNLAVI